MPLTVPAPALTQKDVNGHTFFAEKPIDLSCGPVTFPDSTPLTPANALQFGFTLFREGVAPIPEAWDESGKSWVPGDSLPEPQSLFLQDGTWRSLLLAIGQKDSHAQDKLHTNMATGLPKYFVRCFFRGKDASGVEQSGESPNSQSFQVLGVGEQNRAGLGITPPDPVIATEISLFLKDSTLTNRGSITIRQDPGGLLIELSVNGAKVTLGTDGGIVLSPSPGQGIQIQGDLEVQGNVLVNGVNLNVP
jgi:hypothetical protein